MDKLSVYQYKFLGELFYRYTKYGYDDSNLVILVKKAIERFEKSNIITHDNKLKELRKSRAKQIKQKPKNKPPQPPDIGVLAKPKTPITPVSFLSHANIPDGDR